jgi:hypothetical protein
MSRNSSVLEESLLAPMSVVSIVASAGGAFHGHTIEAWDYERQVSALREEVRESLDESRRSKLYCQQVKKDLQNLISTELDGKQDTEMLGDISTLLSSTNTLVEKFAVFERYLREKIASDQQDREGRIIEATQRHATNLVDALREDVRETLKSFRHEILTLRNAQLADHASLKEHCAAITRDVHSELTEVVATKFSNAEKNAGSGIANIQRVIETLEQRAAESAASLKKYVTANLSDVRLLIDEATKDVARSRQLEEQKASTEELRRSMDVRVAELSRQVSMCDRSRQLEEQKASTEELRRSMDVRVAELSRQVSMCEQGISRCEITERDDTARLERRIVNLDESRAAAEKRIAELSRQLAVCENGVETTAGLGTDHATRLERRVALIEGSHASLELRVSDSIEAQIKSSSRHLMALDDEVKHSFVAVRKELSTMQTNLTSTHTEVHNKISLIGATTKDALAALEVNSKASQHAAIEILEKRLLADELPKLHKRIDVVENSIRGDVMTAKNDVKSLQDVFISVFGKGHDGQPLQTLDDSLLAHRNNVVQDLLVTHIKRLESSIAESNETSREHSVGALHHLQQQMRSTQDEIRASLQIAEAKASYRLRHQAVCFLTTNLQTRRRGTAFHTWLSFAAASRAQRQEKKEQRRRWAVGVLERTVVPQLTTALRRNTFHLWKRFLTLKRGYKRINRTAMSLCSVAQRQLAARYLMCWVKHLKHLRRPKRYVAELQVRSKAVVRRGFFGRWVAHVMALRRRRTLHRDAHVLSLCGLRSVVGNTSLVNVPMSRDRLLLWQKLSPRDWAGAKQLWHGWVQHCWRRRLTLLRRSAMATDAIVEATRVDLGALVGQVRDVQDTNLAFQKRVTFITDLFEAPRLSHSTVIKESTPSKSLVKAIQHLSSGYATIHDIFAFLSLWVETVERTQRTLTHDVANLQAWSVAVDEEIRRVQKFVRPPFK